MRIRVSLPGTAWFSSFSTHIQHPLNLFGEFGLIKGIIPHKITKSLTEVGNTPTIARFARLWGVALLNGRLGRSIPRRSTSLTVRLSLTALSKVEWAALSLSKGG
jgi:hypothetical protein